MAGLRKKLDNRTHVRRVFDEHRLSVVSRYNGSKLPVYITKLCLTEKHNWFHFFCTNLSLFPYCTLYTANHPEWQCIWPCKLSNSIGIFISDFFFTFYGVRRIFAASTTCLRLSLFALSAIVTPRVHLLHRLSLTLSAQVSPGTLLVYFFYWCFFSKFRGQPTNMTCPLDSLKWALIPCLW